MLFIGHGSPMNGIENNYFSQRWKELGKEIPEPVAVVCISAHWLTKGTFVTAMSEPRTIHDFRGFPKQLYEVVYPAPGSPSIAMDIKTTLKKSHVAADHVWGLDHGTWTILRHMYPDAGIPVLQLSIDYHKNASYHYELAKDLTALREKGMLVIGSGNMVHNLGMVAWDRLDDPEFGYDWAQEMNDTLKKLILEASHKKMIEYQNLGGMAKLAIPTPDHYYPLLYILAMQQKSEPIIIFNDYVVGGSISMTSVKIG